MTGNSYLHNSRPSLQQLFTTWPPLLDQIRSPETWPLGSFKVLFTPCDAIRGLAVFAFLKRNSPLSSIFILPVQLLFESKYTSCAGHRLGKGHAHQRERTTPHASLGLQHSSSPSAFLVKLYPTTSSTGPRQNPALLKPWHIIV